MGEDEGVQPWASCGHGGFQWPGQSHRLRLPDHAVLWFLRPRPLVGNCVPRIPTLVLEYHRAVVKLFPGGTLRREGSQTQGEVRETHPSLGWGGHPRGPGEPRQGAPKPPPLSWPLLPRGLGAASCPPASTPPGRPRHRAPGLGSGPSSPPNGPRPRLDSTRGGVRPLGSLFHYSTKCGSA